MPGIDARSRAFPYRLELIDMVLRQHVQAMDALHKSRTSSALLNYPLIEKKEDFHMFLVTATQMLRIVIKSMFIFQPAAAQLSRLDHK